MLPEQPTHPAHSGQGVIFSLEVDDADGACAHAQEHKCRNVLALRSENREQPHFSIQDPNGVHLAQRGLSGWGPGHPRRRKHTAKARFMNSRWTDLKNTGKQTARRLQEAGIHSEEALRTVEALGAHARIPRRYPDESLPICYDLYAFVADKG